MKDRRSKIAHLIFALLFALEQAAGACPAHCLAPPSSLSAKSPPKISAKDARTLKSITRGLDDRQKDFVATYVSRIETVRWGIRRCRDAGLPDSAGELILEALARGIPGVTYQDAVAAIRECIAKGWEAEAAKLAGSFFDRYIATIPSGEARELIRAFEPWPDKYGKFVMQGVRARVEGVSISEAKEALGRLFAKDMQSKAGLLAADIIAGDAAGECLDEVRGWIETCIDKRWIIQVPLVAAAAIEKYPGMLTASEVKRWVRACVDNGWHDEARMVAVAAIENGTPELSEDDIMSWIRTFRDKAPAIAGKIAVAAAAKKIYGVTVADVYATMERCKQQGWGTAIGVILARAVRGEVPGLTAEAVREWIDICLRLDWPQAAGEIACAVIERKFPGITPQEITGWLSVCTRRSPRIGGNVALAALRNGVAGVTPSHLRLAITMCLAQDGLEHEGIRLAQSALEQGGAWLSADDISGWVQAAVRSFCFDEASDIAVRAVTLRVPDLQPLLVNAWIRQCFNNGRPRAGMRIALAAVESGSGLVSPQDADHWIRKCAAAGLWNEAGYFSMALAEADRQTVLFAEPGLAAAVADTVRFVADRRLGQAACNRYVIRRMMELDLIALAQLEDLLAGFSAAFDTANRAQEEGRRVEEETFRSYYEPQAVIMELVIPGSIKYMTGLLKQSGKPQSVTRFLDAKAKALMDERVTGGIAGLQTRITTRERTDKYRQKIKIEASAMFKLLDLANSFVEMDRTATVVEQLRSFDVSRKIADLTDLMSVILLSDLAASLGIENTVIEPGVYAKMYIPYLGRLFQAMDFLAARHPAAVDRFKSLLKATLEDRVRGFLEDETQADETGRAIAVHNRQVREQLKARGIDPAKWLGWETRDRLEPAGFVYYEKGPLVYDPVSDATAVLDYCRRVLNMRELAAADKEALTVILKTAGILAERAFDGTVTRLVRDKKDRKKGDLIACVAAKETLEGLESYAKQLLAARGAAEIPAVRETLTHFGDRVRTLALRLQDAAYRGGLAKQRKYFTVRQFLREPGRDLFMGDFTGCCLAMNSGQYPDAMVDRLIDEGTSVVEVLDDATGKTVACLWLYIADDGSLVVQNIEINADYEREKPLMDDIADKMIAYAEKLTAHIGAPRLLIGMPGHGKYFAPGGYVEKRYGSSIVPYGKEKAGGYLGEKYFLDTAGKPLAFLVSDLTRARASAKIAPPALFSREKLMGAGDASVALWKEFTAANGGTEPAVVYMNGDSAAVKRQFDQQIRDVPDDRLVYMSIEQNTIEFPKLGQEPARQVTRHIVIVARSADLKENIQNILNGAVWNGKYHFVLFFGEYKESKNIHLSVIALGNELKGRKLMQDLYPRIAQVLKDGLPAGYTITTYAEADPVKEFFEAQFQLRQPTAEDVSRVHSYPSAALELHNDRILVGTVRPLITGFPSAGDGQQETSAPVPSPEPSLDMFPRAEQAVSSGA